MNASRGGVIEESALLAQLKSRHVNAALDVWPTEPLITPELLELVVVASPHIAGYSIEGKHAGTEMIYQAFLDTISTESRPQANTKSTAVTVDFTATTPIDESKGASNLSFALARPSNSKLFVFHAYGLAEEGWSSIRYLLPSGKVEEVKKELEKHYEDELSKIGDYKVEVVPGVPHDEILRFAR